VSHNSVIAVQVAPGRKGHGAGAHAVPGVRAASEQERRIDIMQVKRSAHARAIQSHHDDLENRAAASAAALNTGAQGVKEDKVSGCAHAIGSWSGTGAVGAELGAGRFREAGFFIAAENCDKHEESGFALAERGHRAIAAEVMDLNAETSEGLAAQKRRQTVWDVKKKRYVTLQKDEVMKGGKRVTSDRAKRSKRDERTGQMYRQWVKQVGGNAGEALGKGVKGGHSALEDRCAFALFPAGLRLWQL
jgi:hypothetical protein